MTGRFGAGAHTDYGMITLLMTDGEPGLQIQVDPSDPASWQDVPHLPGAFIVNLGDMLQCWTNDRFRSTMHRVVIQDRGRDRFSLPYFIEPNFHTLVECLPTCRSEDGSAKHEPISAGEYLLAKYARVHKDFKAFHEKAEAMPSGQRDAASTCDKT